jgi:hypothetical protein
MNLNYNLSYLPINALQSKIKLDAVNIQKERILRLFG